MGNKDMKVSRGTGLLGPGSTNPIEMVKYVQKTHTNDMSKVLKLIDQLGKTCETDRTRIEKELTKLINENIKTVNTNISNINESISNMGNMINSLSNRLTVVESKV